MDTREKIIDTASRLFYTQGYNNTGINQVIKEAEIAKATLYQHFPSKEDLLVEYLNVKADVTNEALQRLIAQHTTPRDKALSLFDFLITYITQADFNGCNFLNIAAELPLDHENVKELVKKQKDQTRSLFVEILKPIGKEEIADELYLLFDGAMMTSKVYADIWPIQTARKIAEKLL